MQIELAASPIVRTRNVVRLESVLVEKRDRVAPGALLGVFGALQSGERVEFVHTLDACERTGGRRGYALRIAVVCTPGRCHALRRRIVDALAYAYPNLNFSVARPARGGARREARPLVRIAPSGLHVTSSHSRFEGDTTPPGHLWPWPADLPGWPLYSLLSERLSLPACEVELAVRVHGLPEGAMAELGRLLQRVEAGSCSVRDPQQVGFADRVSGSLQERAMAHMRVALQRRGFLLDAIVASRVPVGEVALGRIAHDVFGDIQVNADPDATPEAAPGLAAYFSSAGELPGGLVPVSSGAVRHGIRRHFAVPEVLPAGEEGTRIGETASRTKSAIVLPSQLRTRHTVIVGASGAGKSNLIATLVAADIASGAGLAVISPHAEDCDRIVAMVPRSRARDLIYVDAASTTHCVPFNPLESAFDPAAMGYQVGQVANVLDEVLETKDSAGPAIRSHVRNLLLLVCRIPDGKDWRPGTLMDAARVLEDDDYATYLVEKAHSRAIKERWATFMSARGGEHGYHAWKPWIAARVNAVLQSRPARRMLGIPRSEIDIAAGMRDRKIMIVNLDRSAIAPAEGGVLAALMLSAFFGAAVARGRHASQDRPPFHIYIDEAGSVLGESAPRLFEQLRKYQVSMTAAMQSLAQLENRWGRANVSRAILANTANRFLFRVGPEDARTLAHYAYPCEPDDLCTLPDFHAVSSIGGAPGFVVRMDAATARPHESGLAQEIVAMSNARHGIPIEAADRELERLYQLNEVSTDSNEGGVAARDVA